MARTGWYVTNVAHFALAGSKVRTRQLTEVAAAVASTEPQGNSKSFKRCERRFISFAGRRSRRLHGI
jgi:hypothetical protein